MVVFEAGAHSLMDNATANVSKPSLITPDSQTTRLELL